MVMFFHDKNINKVAYPLNTNDVDEKILSPFSDSIVSLFLLLSQIEFPLFSFQYTELPSDVEEIDAVYLHLPLTQ